MRLIDGDALTVGLKLAAKNMAASDSEWLKGYADGLDAASNAVDDAPTIDAVPVVRGRWLKDRDGDEYCSKCSRYMPVSEVTGDPSAHDYCPNCGAKMDGAYESALRQMVEQLPACGKAGS